MVDCDFCGKKIDSLSFKCKFCGLYYCDYCRLPESHNCLGLRIHNREQERKFKEKIFFVSKNYAKADDRGYTVIVDKPTSKVREEIITSPKNNKQKKIKPDFSYVSEKNPGECTSAKIDDRGDAFLISSSVTDKKYGKSKKGKPKDTTRKTKFTNNISRSKTKSRSVKNKTLYLSLLCIGVLATFVFMNGYGLNDTFLQESNLDSYNGISKNKIPIAKASGESVQLINYNNATDPTWDELISFLRNDSTDELLYNDNFVCADFAEMLHNNAEINELKAGYVSVDFLDMESHALNVFYTTDKGLVYVDCTGDTEKLGALDSRDKIAYVQINRELGLVSAYKTNSPEYEFYEIHKRKRFQGVPGVYFEPLGTVKDVKIYW